MSLGGKIREARRTLGMTQQDLAGDEFSKSFISQLERDMVNPSLNSLKTLARRLNQPLSELLEDTEPRPASEDWCELAEALLWYRMPEQASDCLEKASLSADLRDGADGSCRTGSEDASARQRARTGRLSGLVKLQSGMSLEAMEEFKRALVHASGGEQTQELVKLLCLLGDAYLEGSLYLRAARCFEDALKNAPSEPTDACWRPYVLLRLARLHSLMNDEKESARLRREAEDLCGEIKDIKSLGRRYLQLALSVAEAGKLHEAAGWARRARILAEGSILAGQALAARGESASASVEN